MLLEGDRGEVNGRRQQSLELGFSDDQNRRKGRVQLEKNNNNNKIYYKKKIAIFQIKKLVLAKKNKEAHLEFALMNSYACRSNGWPVVRICPLG